MNKSIQMLLIAAVVAVGWAVNVGFQSAQEKVGSVDITQVLEKSKVGETQNEKLRNAWQIRNDLLNFAAENMCMTEDQATKLVQLSLKNSPTAADKTELETVKKAVADAGKQLQSLATKADKTDAEKELMTDLSNRARLGASVVQQWNAMFSQDMDALGETLRNEAVAKVRVSIAAVAKQKGYTQVFEANTLVYSSNDLTPDVIAAVDAAN